MSKSFTNIGSSANDKVLVLFIHGLNGKQKTWDKFLPWLNTASEIKNLFEIGFYNYPTSLFENLFKPLPNIQTIADGLKSHIDLNCSNFSKIILACHSMVGLVARKYLLNHIKRSKQEVLRVKSLLLYATPNNGSDIANVNIFNPWHKQIKQLRRTSDFIEELNDDWDLFKLKIEVDTKYICAGRDTIVSKTSAKHFWGNQSIVMNVNKSHLGVVRPYTNDDVSLRVLIQQIKKVYDIPNYDESDEPINEDE